MDLIKNKTKCIDSMNDLLNWCGEPQEVAKKVDDVIFDYFGYLCSDDKCVGKYDNDIIITLRHIRNLFINLGTN